MREETQRVSKEVKHKQNRNLLIVIVVFSLGLLGLFWLMNRETGDQKSESKKWEPVSFANPTDAMDTQSLWMERAQNELKAEQSKTAALQQTVEKMQNTPTLSSLEADPAYHALQQQVQALQKARDEQVAKNPAPPIPGDPVSPGAVFSTVPGASVPPSMTKQPGALPDPEAGIDNDILHLKPRAGTRLPVKNADTYVPAGTFAEAIMLGAADASAGVNSQSKPVPMLFRLIAEGTLPNHQTSHLKNCIAIGAVTGDISSERGEIRVERLSCTFPTGEIVEQVVEGTIFGMDAKNGVRGNPVWREGSLLGRAAIAGSLSGLANGISQHYTTNSISPLGTTQTVDNGAIFKNGLASGASNAMEKLADYNIRRAEQYHPVIQLSAGQPVDVVFLRGFYLDGKKHDELTQENQENQSPPELFTTLPETTPSAVSNLTLSEKELARIQQHENAITTTDTESRGTMP